MLPDEESFEAEHEETEGYVPVVFAHSLEEAEVYCEILSDHNISTIVGDETKVDEENGGGSLIHRTMTHGLPVLVPEETLDEAGEIIAKHEELDDFVSPYGDDDEYEDIDDEFGETPEIIEEDETMEDDDEEEV